MKNVKSKILKKLNKAKFNLRVFWHLFVYRRIFSSIYRRTNVAKSVCFVSPFNKKKRDFKLNQKKGFKLNRLFNVSFKSSLSVILILIIVSAQAVNLKAYEGYVVEVSAKISSDLPEIDPPGGEYCTDETEEVALSFETDNDETYIAYTTDGTNPVCGTLDTKIYENPFEIGETTTVKASTCHNGAQSKIMEWVFEFDSEYCDPYCGDGEKDDGEECDDGNNEDGDGCSAICETEEVTCDQGIGIVVLDTSGSMGTKMIDAQNAAKKVVENILEDGGSVGYVDFDAGINLSVAPTIDKMALFAAIDTAVSADPGQYTNTAEAFREAENLLDAVTADYKFAVFITDGNPYLPGSSDIVGETKTEASAFSYVKYGLGVSSDGSPPTGLNQSLMEELFGVNNYFHVDDWGNLNVMVDDLLETVCPGDDDEETIKINKVYYSPDAEHGYDIKNEWVELYNPTNSSVDVSGWEIKDNGGADTLPAGSFVPANGYAIITARTSTWGYWNIPNSVEKIVLNDNRVGNGLKDSGDMLVLKNSDGVVDQMNWGDVDTSWKNYNADVWNPGVPNVAKGRMLGRVPTGVDTDLPADWKDLALPSVTLTYPVGGIGADVWHLGKTYEITWEAVNPNGDDSDLTVDLYYSRDSGNTWGLIDEGVANTGLYSWFVTAFVGNNTYPTPGTENARIKVVVHGPENIMLTAWDESEDFCPPIECDKLNEAEKLLLASFGFNDCVAEVDMIAPMTVTGGGGGSPAEPASNGDGGDDEEGENFEEDLGDEESDDSEDSLDKEDDNAVTGEEEEEGGDDEENNEDDENNGEANEEENSGESSGENNDEESDNSGEDKNSETEENGENAQEEQNNDNNDSSQESGDDEKNNEEQNNDDSENEETGNDEGEESANNSGDEDSSAGSEQKTESDDTRDDDTEEYNADDEQNEDNSNEDNSNEDETGNDEPDESGVEDVQ